MITRLIVDKENELNELAQTPKKQKSTNGKSYLRDYLDQFVKEKVRGLRIILSKTDNLVVEIRRTKSGAKLSMTNIKKLETEYLLTEERLQKLKGLGFYLNGRGDKATATLSDDKDVIVDKIMRLISLIVFEVFYFKELDSESTIEILNKRTGLNDQQ